MTINGIKNNVAADSQKDGFSAFTPSMNALSITLDNTFFDFFLYFFKAFGLILDFDLDLDELAFDILYYIILYSIIFF